MYDTVNPVLLVRYPALVIGVLKLRALGQTRNYKREK